MSRGWEAVLERMQVAPRDRILVLGGADSALTRQLAGLARDGLVLAVDASDEAVRQARRLSVQIDNLMFVLGSPDQIPWQEDFFTKLVGVFSEAWPDPKRAAGEIYRVLEPGGWAWLLEAPEHWAALLTMAGFDPVHPLRLSGDPPAWLLEAQEPPRPRYPANRSLY